MAPDIRAIREEFPALAREVYLNAGGAGPFPRAAAAAVEEALLRDLGRGRMGVRAAEAEEALAARLRGALAELLGAATEEIALAANTTAAQNVVIWGLDWRPGDEVLTTDVEHPGLAAPLATLARRRGAVVRIIPGEEAAADLARAVGRRLSGRTRLVAVSHVSWATGAAMDVRGASAAVRGSDALVLVDGAQSVGAIPVDPAGSGVDAYAFPAHKWLCGPEGLGALWLGPRARREVDLTFASYESGAGHRSDGSFAPHAGARRYETSTPAFPLIPGWLAVLDWLRGLGWAWIHRRTRDMQALARERLSGVPGVAILTPPGPQAGLLTFRPPGGPAEEAVHRLAEASVMVRPIPSLGALRASVGFYNDEADLDRLAEAVSALGG